MGIRVKAVFFDAGGTLVDSRVGLPLRAKFLAERLRSLGYDYGEAEVLRALREVGEYVRSLGTDIEYSRRYLLTLMLLKLGLRGCIYRILEPLYEAYKEAVLTDVYAYEDSVSVLETLKRRGFLLGLISNTTDYESLRDILKRFGMFELFDSIAASVLTLWRKPRREIFLYALSQVDVEPREAVHIGDSLKNDVAGAKSVGMYAVWKVRNKQSLDSIQAPVKPDLVVGKLSEVLDFVELV